MHEEAKEIKTGTGVLTVKGGAGMKRKEFGLQNRLVRFFK